LGQGTVFSLSGAFRDCGLFLGFPADERVAEQKHITYNRISGKGIRTQSLLEKACKDREPWPEEE